MSSVQDFITLEASYCDTFTNREERPWGTLFCNGNQPLHYDSNHAQIGEAVEHPQSVVDEVIHYYQSKNIIPRFYLNPIEVQQPLLLELKSRGFGYEELISPIQLWNGQVAAVDPDPRITIEQVTEANYREALEIECSIQEFGGREAVEQVYRQQFEDGAFTHYLLRLEGGACCTACIFADGEQARLESVATLEAYRGQGLVGRLIRWIQQEVLNRGVKQLWVAPINERVERVYEKYGFQTVARLVLGHAFLGGKSIKEIQG
ncbi:GNAT family N-acetyltransferase [Paenibacillus donghaensis]|uniref:GNAT family N-acetyltransferase n=1 Tax=Paenibacillus donghaensis TaxID=414771 RepID=A0A2Z2K5Q8_9BACL|nr:GNAT family N-acetyltransferase [Paenibacillus donghaensis]ASA19934.1 GNAT family N-acetyltransferase [Paenibacillus donghaensis]